ncbi:MAG: RNA methyltransferase, partial [Candidatus Eremiobacteraeota bacterium]|nr:RNA methyltransferase [Candidatus Eremiobacteraeota bacterium]
MPTELSPHNPRIEAVRDLRTPRGRRAGRCFTAEGPTLLEEAQRTGLRPREIYATPAGLGRFDPGRFEADGTGVYVVTDRVFARLSDLETPSGILAVFDLPDRTAADVLARPGP